ncbi:MAG: hypothetical protein JW891_15690 [Candidatus Lokiarchaeota archaeon]|nr:hypothetical protein [Candidatus Lokiarchaeota archaeon]
MGTIQELLILNESGIALFHHRFSGDKNRLDIQLIASYFDLICRYVKNEMNASLKSFTLENQMVFFFSHESGLHLVFICNNDRIDIDLLNLLADITIENFIVLFKNKLKNFNGEISIFKSFSEIVEDIIKAKMWRLKKHRLLQH